jgi:integrase
MTLVWNRKSIESFIKNAITKGTRLETRFNGHQGLILRASPSGSVNFQYRANVNGKVHTTTVYSGKALTDLGDISAEYKKVSSQKDIGINPFQDKKAGHKLETITNEYLELKYKDARGDWKRSTQQIRSRVKLHIIDNIGYKDIKEITEADLASILVNIAKTGKYRTADLVRIDMRGIFKHAKKVRGLIKHNPTLELETIKKPQDISNASDNPFADMSKDGKAIPLDQLAVIWRYLNLSNSNASLKNAIRLHAFCGKRTTETRLAKWSHIDFNKKIWGIPVSNLKNTRGTHSKSHIVPLTDTLVSILKNQREYVINKFGPECEWVFPNTKGNSLSSTAISQVIRKMRIKLDKLHKITPKVWPKIYYFTDHHFRHTITTELTPFTDSETRDKLLNHKIQSTQDKHYNEHDFLEEKLKALTIWEGILLEALKTNKNSNLNC